MIQDCPDNACFNGVMPHVMDALQFGVVIVDASGQIVLWNAWMSRYSGIAQQQALGRPLHDVFPDLESKRLIEAVKYAQEHRLPSYISPSLHHTPLPLFSRIEDRPIGRRIQQLIQVIPLLQADRSRSVLIQISDQTATVNREKLLRQQSEELRRTNYLDPLTGIPNRRKLDESLSEEFRRAQRDQRPLTLILIDIDHFKRYNDHYGHPQGDQCLMRVATAIQACIKRAGDLAARYGGEEFAVLLPGMDDVKARVLAEDIRLRISALAIRHEASPVAPHISISLGVAVMVPEIGTNDISALISAADVALYEAKREGRNRGVLFSITDGSFHACA